MPRIEALDSDSSIMNNLPLGYYYYYIPYNNLEYGKFLGVCSAIESLTYNPFLSLAYNGGLGAVTTSPMYQYFLSNPNDSRIGTEWVSWYTNGGLAGLVLRRQAEFNIYSNGVYEYRPIAQVNQNGIITGIAVSDNNGNGYIPANCKGEV